MAEALRPRIRVGSPGDVPAEIRADTPGSYNVAGLEIGYTWDSAGALRWSIANPGPDDRAIESVAFAWDTDAVPPAVTPLMFVHGYQSWSPTRTMRLGIDTDPSRDPRPIPLVRAAFHADPGVTAPGVLRSEQVTVVAIGAQCRLVGFAGGARHAGTIHARRVDECIEWAAVAWFGGAVLRAGETRRLHDVLFDDGVDATTLLERWAFRVGADERARTASPHLVGWCSWYHYFHDVTEADLRANLARADDWPFTVFQLDDGFQRAIGDWLETNERFPAGIEGIAAQIAGTRQNAGLWLAPFLAAPDSRVATQHPEWLARAPDRDQPAIGMFHNEWGGVMWQLDTTHPDVVAHLESTAARLVELGFRYLKLDFTFSAAMPGRFHDPTRTPAERVRAGYDAIRRGAGAETFILGCGAPLGAVVGVVDAMRIGADVAPWWEAPPDADEQQPAYEETTPATRHAFVNTCTRSFLHRRLWANDPDCVMLRSSATNLSEAAARGWARTVAASGGLVLVSDDLSLLDQRAGVLLADVVEQGAAADAEARRGRTARAIGLLDPAGPTGLDGPAGAITVDPVTGEETGASPAIRSGI